MAVGSGIEIEQASCQGVGNPGRVPLGRLGDRPGPTPVHGLDEQAVPTIEELDLEGLELVHIPVSAEDRTVLARMSQQDPTPVIALIGFQRGLTVGSRSQLGRPA